MFKLTLRVHQNGRNVIKSLVKLLSSDNILRQKFTTILKL